MQTTPIRTAQHTFMSTIRQYQMWKAEDKLLIGVSGGADSVALAMLAIEAGFRVAIAHINFGLRGAASDADMRFVQALADDWAVPIHIYTPDTQAFATTHHLSIQQAARQLRYTWWQSLCDTEGYDRILTAHHAQDQLETLLLYISRGSRYPGYKTIAPVRGNICRPLIRLSKSDIIAYLRAKDQTWREDQSNFEPYYKRNAIRAEIIPLFEQFHQASPARMQDILDLNTSAMHAARVALQSAASTCLIKEKDAVTIRLETLSKEPFALFALDQWLSPLGFTVDQVFSISRLEATHTGQIFKSKTWILTHDRGLLKAKKIDQLPGIFSADVDTLPAQLTVNGKSFLICKSNSTTPQETGWLKIADWDASVIQLPLTLRTWHAGDKIHLGKDRGTRKIKDLLINRKFDFFQKMEALVLQDDKGRILWAIDRYHCPTALLNLPNAEVIQLWMRDQ